MSNDTREALAALMVIAAECAQRKPLRGFEELTEATHIGHHQFGRAHEKADEAVRMLAVRLRAVFDTLAASLATQPAQPVAEPFWHAVVSASSPANNCAIRRADVADEKACALRSAGIHDATAIALYAAPQPAQPSCLKEDEC